MQKYRSDTFNHVHICQVTPAKHELDIMQVTTVLIIRENWENNGTEKFGLVTPTHVSATYLQTIPTVAYGVSIPLCCQLTLSFTLISVNIYHYILLYIFTGRYKTMLTFDSNRCRSRCKQLRLRFELASLLSHLHLSGMLHLDIPLIKFTWPA